MLRDSLSFERQYFGPYPLNMDDQNEWDVILEKHKKLLENINKKVAKYNLLVPMINQQMLFLKLEQESDKILINGRCSPKTQLRRQNAKNLKSNNDNSENYFFNLFQSFFKI